MKMRVFITLLYSCGFTLAAQDTGAPAGFMADCPGMTKLTILSETTKQSLYVVLVYPSSSLLGYSEKKCKLSDEGAACAAKHLDLRKKKTVIIISGYMDSSSSPLARTWASLYLESGRNVIVVEIFPILIRTYPLAARLTKPLGELLGKFLANLTRQGLSSNRLELLGASLGAHIASYAAVKYTQLTGRRPARLTGLDPAGPCFRNLPPAARFNADAAQRVDALHTNIDGFGIAQPVANVDFYANGGEFQPAMAGNFILPCFQLCSHVRAALLWMVSHTNPEKFVAVRCDSVTTARHGQCYSKNITSNVLGPKTNFNKPGIYYLPTAEKPPYYIGKDGLKQRNFNSNNYLLKSTPDKDVIISN